MVDTVRCGYERLILGSGRPSSWEKPGGIKSKEVPSGASRLETEKFHRGTDREETGRTPDEEEVKREIVERDISQAVSLFCRENNQRTATRSGPSSPALTSSPTEKEQRMSIRV